MYKEIIEYSKAHKVQLVVVSKYRPLDQIKHIYDQGQRDFAENRVQDLIPKVESLPKDIRWHLIGTLQSNKVKYIAPFIHLIHSLDDASLWKEINKQALKNNRVIPCLLQIKIGTEETKNGFDWNALIEFLETRVYQAYKNVNITGVMGMASFTKDELQIRKEFTSLKGHFNNLKKNYFTNNDFHTISMGMSSDYKLAIEEGSTLIRVGSAVFETI